MKSLSESLAGRVRLIDLWPLSQGELRGTRERFADRLIGSTETLRRATCDRVDRPTELAAMCAGGCPEAVRAPVRLRDGWFRDYVRAVTQRDVRAISRLERLEALPRLLRLLAAQSSQEVNLSDVSRALGISRTAIDSYVGVLEVVGLWHRAVAWSGNLTSKAVEVKASASFTSRDLRGLGTFADELGDRFANGVVLYLGDDVVPLGPRRTALPISALWTR